MICKIDFLNDLRLVVEKKALDRWFYSNDFAISKKLIRSWISEIFGYLSLDTVYINIFDKNLEKLVINDLNEIIFDFISHCDDYSFMNNFKGSVRHWHNKERDRLMKFLEIFDFEQLRLILESTRKKNSKGGRPGYDVVLMYKILFIRSYYNLSDEKTARRIKSDDAIMCFLGYP